MNMTMISPMEYERDRNSPQDMAETWQIRLRLSQSAKLARRREREAGEVLVSSLSRAFFYCI